MLVDSMNFKEAATHLIDVKDAAMKKIAWLINNKNWSYWKIMKKLGDVKHYFKPIEIEKFGTRLYLCPYSLGKSDFKEKGMLFHLFAKVYYKKDIYWCLYCNNLSIVYFFKNHLIKRYLERHCGEDTTAKTVTFEDVHRFFKETDVLCKIYDDPNSKEPNGIKGNCSIGTLCGNIMDGEVVFRTFIDASTVNGFKKEVYDKRSQNHFVTRYLWGVA